MRIPAKPIAAEAGGTIRTIASRDHHITVVLRVTAMAGALR